MKLFATAVAVAAFSLAGCASIINEKTQNINVSASNGAAVKGNIDGVAFTGPGIVTVTRSNKDQIITTETPGCVKQSTLNKTVDPVFYVNILAGGSFGSSTDYSTEKMWKYDENVVISCK